MDDLNWPADELLYVPQAKVKKPKTEAQLKAFEKARQARNEKIQAKRSAQITFDPEEFKLSILSEFEEKFAQKYGEKSKEPPRTPESTPTRAASPPPTDYAKPQVKTENPYKRWF